MNLKKARCKQRLGLQQRLGVPSQLRHSCDVIPGNDTILDDHNV